MCSYTKLAQTKSSSTYFLLRHIIDNPHDIFSGFNPLQMMSVIMNLESFIPAAWNEQLVSIIIDQKRNLMRVWGINIDNESWKQIYWCNLALNSPYKAPPLSMIQLDYADVSFYDILIIFNLNSFGNRPYLYGFFRTYINLQIFTAILNSSDILVIG